MSGRTTSSNEIKGPPQRKYDKGEKRLKHVGPSAEATVDTGNPKKVVGKCPNNIPDDKKLEVLNSAIAESPEERNLPFPARMFAVYQGVVYNCRTTTRGESYHAFPYHGEMARGLYDKLATSEDARKHSKAFRNWMAKHVRVL